jgi:hypothetical protein
MHVGFWWKSQKRPLGRPRRRWEDNTKIYIGGTGRGDMVWIYLVRDRAQWRELVNMLMNYQVP